MVQMTADQKAKMEKIKALVMGVVRAIDNKKQLNVARYETFFNTSTDEELIKWADSMGKTLDSTIQIFELPFEECNITQIKAAADVLNIPLEEYVWFKDKDEHPIRTRYRVPVGYVPIKRLQQMLNKKNHITTEAEKRSIKSGQVSGEDKVSSIIEAEAYGLLSVNADEIMKELYGPRADGYDKKSDFYNQISTNGYCDLTDLETDLTKHTTLNTINTYLLASGLKTDLVSNTLKTPYTLELEANGRNK